MGEKSVGGSHRTCCLEMEAAMELEAANTGDRTTAMNKLVLHLEVHRRDEREARPSCARCGHKFYPEQLVEVSHEGVVVVRVCNDCHIWLHPPVEVEGWGGEMEKIPFGPLDIERLTIITITRK